MTANRYHPGDILRPHIDLPHFEDSIFILSLESEAVMTFEMAAQHCECLLAPGDLLLLQEEARFAHTLPHIGSSGYEASAILESCPADSSVDTYNT